MTIPAERKTVLMPRRREVLRLTGAWVGTVAAGLATASPAQARSRAFPATALRGDIRFAEAPEILLNGRPTRLAPGARVRDLGNLIVTPGSLLGQRAVVNYTLDDLGNVRDVWLLTPEEAARRWPRTAAEAERLVFDPAAQTWSRP